VSITESGTRAPEVLDTEYRCSLQRDLPVEVVGDIRQELHEDGVSTDVSDPSPPDVRGGGH
jgi:hypothetical protein